VRRKKRKKKQKCEREDLGTNKTLIKNAKRNIK